MRRFWPMILMVVSLLAFAGPANACSCAMLAPEEMLEFAPTAFVGTVTAAPGVMGGGGGTALFTFEVETVLAGEVPKEVDVSTPDSSAACGFEAVIGTRMAVFASDDGNGVLTSGLCSTTDPDLALKALGPGVPPDEGTPRAPAEPENGFDWPALWLGIGGLAVVGAVWVAGRGRG